MGDDGIGLELLARVQERWSRIAASADAGAAAELTVEFVDGGTGGMELVPLVQETDRLLILDAIAASNAPKITADSPHMQEAEVAAKEAESAAKESALGAKEAVPAAKETASAASAATARVTANAAAVRTAGQAVRISGDQVPRLLASKLSPHQVSLLDVLTACRLLGTEPQTVEVVGVVPADVSLRLGVSAEAASGLPGATDLALAVLAEWQSAR